MNIYRPPKAPLKSFIELLRHIQNYLDPLMDKNHHDINIMGDFNFPNIDWVTQTSSSSQGRDSLESAEAFLDFIGHNMLTQVVDCPTRENSLLDLFLTNNDRVICNIETDKTTLSDHKAVKINLLYNIKTPNSSSTVPSFEDDSFRSLDLQKADFAKINNLLSEVDWDALFDLCNDESDGNNFVELLYLTVLQVCQISSPKKFPNKTTNSPSRRPKTEHSRNRFVLNRKRRKLSSRLEAIKASNPASPRIKKIEDEISIILIYFHAKEFYNLKQSNCKKASCF